MELVLMRKRRVYMAIVLLGSAMAFTAGLVGASRVWADERFYKDSDQPGYWWGKDSIEEMPEVPQKKEPVTEAKKPEEKRRIPKLSDYTMQQLWDMYPDDFRALMDDFQKKAVQQPTEENVKEYYTMVDMARRKAAAFMNVQQLVLQKNPELSLARDDSYLSPAKDATHKLEQEVKARVEAAHDDYALIYFYQDSCPYCEAQTGIMQFMVSMRHWNVQSVNIAQRPELAAKFNVTVTPTTLLIKKGVDDYLTMATGVITLADLDDAIYSGMRLMEGEIKPEQNGMREYQRGGGLDPLAPLNRR